jgi:hypothetical protein
MTPAEKKEAAKMVDAVQREYPRPRAAQSDRAL